MAGLILASGSPRRKEILEQAGIAFEVLSVDHEEYSDLRNPEDFVKELALQKAEAAANVAEKKMGFVKSTEIQVILGADTVVVLDHKILGKPKDTEDAFRMLHSLQGKTHKVVTGVAVLISCQAHKSGHGLVPRKDGKEAICFAEETLVKVAPMEPEEIRRYLETGEPMDKAGSYAIQGRFCRYIEGITGDYYNVVGFPIGRFCQEMKRRGLLDFL